MRIVSIVGSPHGIKGNTARLLALVLEGAKSEGAKTKVITLAGGTVLPCRGCDGCHKKGRCSQKDDFESLKQDIMAADGLVLASPNYICHVSAQLKAFMDRSSGIAHCLSFEGKYGASVVTSGGGEEEPIVAFMNHFLIMTGIRPAGAVWATMPITGDSFPEDIRDRAVALGKNLVQSWKNRTTRPETEKEMAMFKEKMRALISFRKDEWPYEYKYWQEHYGLT